MSKICNIHDSASLIVDCKSLTLGWISLSLYEVVVDSYNLQSQILTLTIKPKICWDVVQSTDESWNTLVYNIQVWPQFWGVPKESIFSWRSALYHLILHQFMLGPTWTIQVPTTDTYLRRYWEVDVSKFDLELPCRSKVKMNTITWNQWTGFVTRTVHVK